MVNGKWTKAVSIHHLPFTIDRFPLAFAPPSLYHVTLPAFVRESVRGRRIFGQFFNFWSSGRVSPLRLQSARV
jgi:hypothetical protein